MNLALGIYVPRLPAEEIGPSRKYHIVIRGACDFVTSVGEIAGFADSKVSWKSACGEGAQRLWVGKMSIMVSGKQALVIID